MTAFQATSSEWIQRYIIGDDIRLAGLVVGLISIGVATSLGLIPLFGDSGESILMAVAFGVLPGLGGILCGWYSLGALSAGCVGITPGIIMYLYQVVLGTNGDLSRIGFSFMLTTVAFPISLGGFAVGMATGIFLR